MKHFWTFYQDLTYIEHPFRVFGPAHVAYILASLSAIWLCFRAYKRCGEAGRRTWQRGFAYYFFIQEMFFYAWTYFSCNTDPLFEVLQLELCTACLFMNFSTLFHQNKQVRFFGALVGLIGGPIAILYPATVAEIYPAFCYRLINFFMTHTAYVFFSLMLLSDSQLLTWKRLVKNMGIAYGMLTCVYFFDLKFHTQYMFVGTPPEIGFIRAVYDVVGDLAFLPIAIVVFSAYQALMYLLLKKLQRAAYPEQAQIPAAC